MTLRLTSTVTGAPATAKRAPAASSAASTMTAYACGAGSQGVRRASVSVSADVKFSWFLLVVSLVGFVVTFPLWLMNLIDDRMMLGITLVLSWAALWYSAYIALKEARHNESD